MNLPNATYHYAALDPCGNVIKLFDEGWEAEMFLAANPTMDILELCDHCGEIEHSTDCPHGGDEGKWTS